METLFTPWRYAYISADRSPAEGCFLCEAARSPDDPDLLVVGVARDHLVILNRHPYSNGHLMVAPRRHVADPAAEEESAREALWPLVMECSAVLREAYRPDGLNLGMNLGRAAGAGVPDHYHFHVVPRWAGDTNFMSAVGGTRLVPEDLEGTRLRLRPLFARRGL